MCATHRPPDTRWVSIQERAASPTEGNRKHHPKVRRPRKWCSIESMAAAKRLRQTDRTPSPGKRQHVTISHSLCTVEHVLSMNFLRPPGGTRPASKLATTYPGPLVTGHGEEQVSH